MQPNVKIYRTKLGDKEVIIETGKLAGQAGGAVTIRQGDSLIFCAATMGGVREGLDFFPLTVDYEERMYAGGRIPGSFFRREGRPGSEAVLTARMTDRPLRPLFPDGMRNEVQIMLMSFSADKENPLDIIAINAASAALMISDIPWAGPVGAVRIGYLNDKLVVNPGLSEMENSKLDLVVAGTKEAIAMVECGADEISEQIMVEALDLAHKSIQPMIELQEQMAREIGKEKREVETAVIDPELISQVQEKVKGQLLEILDKPYSKENLYGGIQKLEDAIIEEMTGDQADTLSESEFKKLKKSIGKAFGEAEKMIVRERILTEQKRPDGRGPKDIRDIWCEVNFSPRAHGSGLFTRGETQVLTLATLGTPREAQELDNLVSTDSKRYMHHYNFPPFCVGEIRPIRGPSRREIGHGALAEKSIEPVLPSQDDFAYTIRVVSEILESNGSSSMASVCSASLALMNAGVPIKRPVAGVSIGMVREGDKKVLLTDIIGEEDFHGDMDFKVAGTRQGITGVQLDFKPLGGLDLETIAETLAKARDARFRILEKMDSVISKPGPEVSIYAPKVVTVKIDPEKIGKIIGTGGKTINALQSKHGVTIEIEEDGTVWIISDDMEKVEKAKAEIEALTEEVEIGKIYKGKVVGVKDFGAFVEILPGQDGLCHISQLADRHIDDVSDICKVGDSMPVKVIGIDEQGRIKLSRKAAIREMQGKENNKGQRRQR